MSKKANYSYIGIAFIILLFGIIFIPKIVDRVSNGDISRTDESRSEGLVVNGKKTSKNKSDLEYLIIDGQPKKVPEFSFTDQDGKTITNKDYLGQVYVVDFFFTTCPTICPRMSKNLAVIQDKFKDNPDFGIASFSINPENDTPEVLKAYAADYGVTSPNWHLLTGAKEDIYKLSNIGFNIFANIENFEHSGDFALVDKEGYLRSRKDAFGNPKIFYKGVISEQEKVDEDGNEQEITVIQEDIAKLLRE
ncbi:SCO family protein [Psychroserpens sp. NJDZ02]|uniref:SCO family protein n=1 Tax=Psychroserpens sp. NJDZ02 TaxID=2570561 RepID=UPI0010A7C74C|nr:SCO family protein [Psychroserpens sp. NJDZ02]QCE41596.1 SCO family protein [Psychroserpens sp. NJDZ02]